MGVDVPSDAILQGPRLHWEHIDGPMLCWAGHIEWLSPLEWLPLLLRLTSVDRIACKKWPHLERARAALAARQHRQEG